MPLSPLQIRSSTSLFSNWICTFVPLNTYSWPSGLVGSTSKDSTKLRLKLFFCFSISGSSKEQNLNLLHLGYDLHNIYIEFATTDIMFTLYWVLEIIWSKGEDVHRWYVNITLFYIKDLSILDFGNQLPTDTVGQLYTRIRRWLLLCPGYELLKAAWLGNILDFMAYELKWSRKVFLNFRIQKYIIISENQWIIFGYKKDILLTIFNHKNCFPGRSRSPKIYTEWITVWGILLSAV